MVVITLSATFIASRILNRLGTLEAFESTDTTSEDFAPEISESFYAPVYGDGSEESLDGNLSEGATNEMEESSLVMPSVAPFTDRSSMFFTPSYATTAAQSHFSFDPPKHF